MRQARTAPAAEAAHNDDEQSFQDEAPNPPLAPPVRRKGRPRATAAQRREQQPQAKQVALEIDPIVFAAGMARIDQGLAALNQAMPLVQ